MTQNPRSPYLHDPDIAIGSRWRHNLTGVEVMVVHTYTERALPRRQLMVRYQSMTGRHAQSGARTWFVESYYRLEEDETP